MLSLSNDLAAAVERAGRAVVAVNGRRRLASTGMHWRPGLVVTAAHTDKLGAGSRTEAVTTGLRRGPILI